jgi:hypothetical protein
MGFFSSLLGGIFDLCLAAYALLFAWLRAPEIEQLVANQVGAGAVGALLLLNLTPGYIGRIRCYHLPLRAQVILALIGLVYFSLSSLETFSFLKTKDGRTSEAVSLS